ncbi:protein-disulfide reductase DsbD domain-containing protein, partial [Acinetobacter baumannii]
KDALSGTATLQVRYQGCADAGLCYPPQTWEVPVDLALWRADSADGDGAGTAASVPATTDAPASVRTEPRTAQAKAPATLPADRENAGALADWL